MIQTQNRNQQGDHGFVHVGRTLNYAAREISCALDAYISTRVSPELTGMRGMVLGFLMQETESGKQIYQRDLEAQKPGSDRERPPMRRRHPPVHFGF